MNDFLKGYNTQITGGSPSAGPSQSVLEAMGRDAARTQQAGPAVQRTSSVGGTQEFSLKHTLKVLAAGLVFLGLMLGNNAVHGPEGLSIALAVPTVLLLGYSVVLLFVAGAVGSVIGAVGFIKSRWFKYVFVGACAGLFLDTALSVPGLILMQIGVLVGLGVCFVLGRKKG